MTKNMAPDLIMSTSLLLYIFKYFLKSFLLEEQNQNDKNGALIWITFVGAMTLSIMPFSIIILSFRGLFVLSLSDSQHK
jgi:hypothetical protein